MFCPLVVLSVAVLLSSESGVTGTRVTTSKGPLQGRSTVARSARSYFAFTAIPYAEPPVGSLRFKPPLPRKPWPQEEILDATLESPECFQGGLLDRSKFKGQEDCLYLSVYTPSMNGSLPVMMFVHGGGFRVGSGGPPEQANYLLDQDVVLVTPNYRLGPLGFLSREDLILPGNMGMKDLALALDWIRQEIGSFGGDPHQITVFGGSAGGAAAHYLCSSPHTRGKLKGCISQSGVGGEPWALSRPGTARTQSGAVASSVGCFGEGPEWLQCLQNRPLQQLLSLLSQPTFWATDKLAMFSPVIEPSHDGAFLTAWPPRNRNSTMFPWITGIVGNEDLSHFVNKSSMIEFEARRDEYISRMLGLEEGRTDAVRSVVERFFVGRQIIPAVEKMTSEVYFTYPMLRELVAHQGPKYLYVFNYTGGPSTWDMILGKSLNITGVSHGDEMAFLLDVSKKYKPPRQLNRQEELISKQMIKLWTNFAKRTPNSDGMEPLWKQFDDSGSYLSIENSGIQMRKMENFAEIINFWKNILRD